jgi:hypothetical protein
VGFVSRFFFILILLNNMTNWDNLTLFTYYWSNTDLFTPFPLFKKRWEEKNFYLARLKPYWLLSSSPFIKQHH